MSGTEAKPGWRMAQALAQKTGLDAQKAMGKQLGQEVKGNEQLHPEPTPNPPDTTGGGPGRGRSKAHEHGLGL